MKLTPEQRRWERNPFPFPVGFEFNTLLSGSPAIGLHKGEGIDISSGGIGIQTEIPLSPGSVVKIYLPLTDPNTMIPAFSEVCWTSGSENNFRVGLHFL